MLAAATWEWWLTALGSTRNACRGLSLRLDGNSVIEDAAVPALAPGSLCTLGFAAATGAATDRHEVRNSRRSAGLRPAVPERSFCQAP